MGLLTSHPFLRRSEGASMWHVSCKGAGWSRLPWSDRMLSTAPFISERTFQRKKEEKPPKYPRAQWTQGAPGARRRSWV